MHIITGGAGFIGSAFAAKLNEEGLNDLLLVDALDCTEKWKNLRKRTFLDYIDRADFIKMISEDRVPGKVQSITHMGACSTTSELDSAYLMENNYRYTRTVAEYAVKNRIRFIYASSAQTYGDGNLGYSDDDSKVPTFSPMSAYGYSKQLVDLWVLRAGYSSRVAGLKFFNVFGPNEYHKGDMLSVIFKAYHQIKESGRAKLFKSYRPDFKDGEQKRDFIYVKDCCDAMYWLLKNPKVNGIFNLGTGQARTWNELIAAVFKALGKSAQIDYIEMPEKLRAQYQYFTEAQMSKLQATGCPVNFRSLQDGVADYVNNYLEQPNCYL